MSEDTAGSKDSKRVHEKARRGMDRTESSLSLKDKLIQKLTGDGQLSGAQEKAISVVSDVITSGDDPLWAIVLPNILFGSDRIDEIRELLAEELAKKGGDSAIKNLAARIDQIIDAQNETELSINTLSANLDKSIRRGIAAALAEENPYSHVDIDRLSANVVKALKPQADLARIGIITGIAALFAAAAFVAGVFVNKSAYDKYIAELEGKIRGYQAAIAQGPTQGKR